MTTFKEGGAVPDVAQWKVDHWANVQAQGTPTHFADEGESYVTDKYANMPRLEMPTREGLAQIPVGLGDWNYQNPDALGPKGEKLPPGAAGWLPDGNADWGGTVGGWLRGAWHRINEPVTQQNYAPAYTGLTKNALARLEANDPDIRKKMGMPEAGTDPSLGVKIGRGVGEAVSGTLELFNKPAEATEQLYGGVAMAGKELAGENVTYEATKDAMLNAVDLDENSWFVRLVEATNTLNPVNVAQNWARVGIKRVSGELSGEEVTRKFAENYLAAKIAYSALYNEQIKAEMVRRMYAGEDPRLLAKELANPWAELVGQLVIDPLNALDVLGAGATASVRAQKTEKIYGTSDNVVRVLSKLDNVDDLSDANKATRVSDLLTAVMDDAQGVAARMDKYGRDTGLFSFTARGKRAVVQDQTGLLLQKILNHADNPDNALDVLHGLMKVVSSDADEAAVGMSILSNSQDAKVLFSDAGYQLGYVLRNGLMNADGVFDASRFLDDFTRAADNGLPAVLDLVQNKTFKSIDNLFPTVAERLDAITDAKNAMELGKELSPAQLKAIDDHVGIIAKGAHKWADGLPGKGYKALNKFFASVYMGMSPGYAFRNYMNNTLQIFVDAGPKTGAQATLAGVETIGQRVHLADGQFVDKMRDSTRAWLGGIDAPGMNRSLTMAAGAGPSEPMKIFTFASDLADDFEKSAGVAIFSNSVEDSMSKMVREGRAIPAMDDLIRAGMSREAADTLVDLVRKNRGNVDDALDAFRQAQTVGAMPVLDTSTWINATDTNFLKSLGMYDDLVDGVRSANTAQDKLAILDATQNELFDFLRKANNEPTILSREIADQFFGPEMAKVIDKALQSKELSAADQSMRSARVLMYQRTNGDYRTALVELQQAIARQDPSLLPRFADEMRPLQELLSLPFDESSKLRSQTLRARDALGKTDSADDYAKIWRALFDTPMPADISQSAMRKAIWENYFTKNDDIFRNARNAHVNAAEELFQNWRLYNPDVSQKMLEKARQSAALATQFDGAVYVDDIARAFTSGSRKNFDAVVELGNRYGIATAGDTGKPTKRLLHTINKYLPEDVAKFNDLADVPFEVAQDALQKWGIENGVKGMRLDDLNQLLGTSDNAVAEITNKIDSIKSEIADIQKWLGDNQKANIPAEFEQVQDRMLRVQALQEEMAKLSGQLSNPAGRKVGAGELTFPWDDSLPPSMPRVLNEQRDGIAKMFDRLRKAVQDNAGVTRDVAIGPDVDKLLDAWGAAAKSNIGEAQLYAANVATLARDFALHDYRKKTGADIALSYIYPYSFWYTRTYKNWLGRLATHPGVVAAYAKYRSFLEKQHAGMPDWWKYQINTNELLGINSENPLFFNLEATLNPLNGLTGVDFNDPQKRVNWWTQTLDDLNKFGPSTHTLYSMMAAVALYAQGQEDAAARWGSRLIPQTATLKSISALLGLSKTGGWETDPFVHFFSNGSDPYERRRIGRALTSLADKYGQAAIQDAAHTQSGPIWDEAKQLATIERGWGQISSFFLGVGFKARSTNDLQIDRMYEEYFSLWNMKPNLKPEEFRDMMDQLKNKYPFMDSVLISRKGGYERDAAYAYSVVGRIPPGQLTEVAEFAQIDPRLINRFYESKGSFEDWPKQDYDRFMSGIVDIASILDLPDTATRQDWNAAKDAYGRMQDAAKNYYGDDIVDLVDRYYGIDAVERDDFLRQYPQVEKYLDWKAGYVVQDKTLSTYYGGIDQINRYLKGTMYDAIEKETGMKMSEIYSALDEYKLLKKHGGSHKVFRKEHPEIDTYYDYWDKYGDAIDQKTIAMGLRLPEGKPAAIRQDATIESIGQQDLIAGLKPQKPKIEWKYFENSFPKKMVDALVLGEGFTAAQKKEFESYAEFFGLTVDQLYDLIRESMP